MMARANHASLSCSCAARCPISQGLDLWVASLFVFTPSAILNFADKTLITTPAANNRQQESVKIKINNEPYTQKVDASSWLKIDETPWTCWERVMAAILFCGKKIPKAKLQKYTRFCCIYGLSVWMNWCTICNASIWRWTNISRVRNDSVNTDERCSFCWLSQSKQNWKLTMVILLEASIVYPWWQLGHVLQVVHKVWQHV